MNRIESFFNPRPWFKALLLSAFVAGCGGGGGEASAPADPGPGTPPVAGAPTAPGAGTGVGGLGQGPAPVVLGDAGTYVILAQSGITNIPTSAVTGRVGLSGTGADITGLTCAEVTLVNVTETIITVDGTGLFGTCRVVNPFDVAGGILAKGTAYSDAQGRAPDYTEVGAGNIGGMTLPPAVYKWGTGVLIPTDVTLSGGPNDVWIFQIAQGLTVSSGVQIILAGGALPQNIFWATFGVAALDTTSQFNGVILSQTSITMKTGASINGRLLAGTAVTLDKNTVTQP
jgi:hypothetical protein